MTTRHRSVLRRSASEADGHQASEHCDQGPGRIKPRLSQVERMGGVDGAAGAIEAAHSMPREEGTHLNDHRVSSRDATTVRLVADVRASFLSLPSPSRADRDPDRASGELPSDAPPRYPYYLTDDGDSVVPRLDWTDARQRNRAMDLMRRGEPVLLRRVGLDGVAHGTSGGHQTGVAELVGHRRLR